MKYKNFPVVFFFSRVSLLYFSNKRFTSKSPLEYPPSSASPTVWYRTQDLRRLSTHSFQHNFVSIRINTQQVPIRTCCRLNFSILDRWISKPVLSTFMNDGPENVFFKRFRTKSSTFDESV